MLAARQTPGHLAENVMHFARVLRTAGLAVGTDRVMLSLQALQDKAQQVRESARLISAQLGHGEKKARRAA